MYAGSLGEASGSEYVGKVTIFDLTEIFGVGKEPSAEMVSDMLLVEKSTGTFMSKCGMSFGPSDKSCEQKFLSAMNKKCKNLGMTKTVFKNPHGVVVDGQVSTSRDMLLLALHAAGAENLLKVWGARNYTVSIKGPHSRELTLRSLVASPIINKEYTFLGGKTGTVNAKKTNAMLLLADKEYKLFLTVVMGATSNENRFIDANKL